LFKRRNEMLEKQITYDHSITESGHIQVRKITRILEDGVEISKTYHRHVVNPGEAYENEDARTKDIASVIHTKTVVDAYKAEEALK
jgi:hypothetical protein